MNTRDTSDHTADLQPLMDLDEAVRYLRGAYARRTLKNLAWKGKLRCIGRGERMRFVPSWLLEDLLSLRGETSNLSQPEDESWSSDAEARRSDAIGASAPGVSADVAARPPARSAKRTPRRASRSRGTSAASDSASSPRAGASKTRSTFFSARRRTTGAGKILASSEP